MANPTPELITVYPVQGIKVRDPQTLQHVPDEGLEVPRSTYWLRRISAGDVTTSKPTAKQAKPAKE
ncbi:DUF2635 domain-containing protein [Desulfovibrio oxamicus]|uniref:DUF2635 domain-containing protein n=1 Tax=Nitratidesulfovibrio oxamicus TaxID=32016 RepID=A0ABS0IZ83_9BACT|nr:DUF2635 domain-containing protein [Nitratidesulfovibrio oxamicus]MBG3875499.1 DUF2635 domain-containing protein [Nitratidesulfovibrio oxamicus]